MNDIKIYLTIDLLIRRVIAAVLDTLIWFVMVFLLFKSFIFEFKINIVFLFLLTFPIYFIVFEVSFEKTPGKFITGIYVKTKQGYSRLELVFRNFIKLIYFSPPLFFTIEFLFLVLFQKTITDLVSHTTIQRSQTKLSFRKKDEIYLDDNLINEIKINIAPEAKQIVLELYENWYFISKKTRNALVKDLFSKFFKLNINNISEEELKKIFLNIYFKAINE